MKLSEIKNTLKQLDKIQFLLPDGRPIPSHFHITEIGEVTRHFIDCGGTIRHTKSISMQLWQAEDFDHRIAPKRFHDIISLSESKLGLGDLDVEVEFQSETIGRYGITFNGTAFLLTSKQTDCLASDKCGVTGEKTKRNLASLTTSDSCCQPGSGCC